MNQLSLRGRAAAVAFAAAAALVAVPAMGATDVADIGTLDQTALSALPAFASASRQYSAYATDLERRYAARAQHLSQPQQQRLVAELQQKLADKQRRLLGPLFQKAQVAVASVASSHDLTVVVDKRIVIYGGQDITKPVSDLLTGPGDPVPPVSTPGPSDVGYVDQQAVDQVPKVKAAGDAFASFKNDEDRTTAAALKNAKTDAAKDQILKDYRKTLDDKQKSQIQPIVDQTRDAISAIAKQKGLVLVVDRGDIIYGGTDITSDVTAKLK